MCLRLSTLGYEIVHRNYTLPRIGEIDVVASRGKQLVFIEVKGRTSDRFGGAFGAMTQGKMNRLRVVALHYLGRFSHQSHEMNEDIMFLAASVLMDDYGTVRNIRFEPLEFA